MGAVDRVRISVRKAQLNRNRSLPEKAAGFTKTHLPRCAAIRTGGAAFARLALEYSHVLV
jgi:hypothetical protein